MCARVKLREGCCVAGTLLACGFSLTRFGQIFVVLCATAASVAAQQADNLSREQLKPLTEFRQQHRRLVPRGYSLIQEIACVAWFARSMAGGWPVMQCSVRAGHWMLPSACNYTGWICLFFHKSLGGVPRLHRLRRRGSLRLVAGCCVLGLVMFSAWPRCCL